MRCYIIMMHVTPQTLLAVATALFLVGCVIGAYRPNRWRWAVAVILPATLLTVLVTFAPTFGL